MLSLVLVCLPMLAAPAAHLPSSPVGLPALRSRGCPDSCPLRRPSPGAPLLPPPGAVSDVDDELDSREREKLAKEGLRDEALRRHNKLRWVAGWVGRWVAGGWV